MSTASPHLAAPLTASSAPSRLFWVEVGALSAVILFLYGWTLGDMAHDWWTEPRLSQGMLLPPLALLIAWMDRARIQAAPVWRDNRGLLVTGLACLVFLLGKTGSEFFLMRFSFVILLTGVIWTFWGYARLRTLFFPLLLIATAVPLPTVFYNTLAAPLQRLASTVAANVAQAVGVSVYRDGNVIQLANISLGVEEACSGLSALSATFVGALLLGYIYCTRISTRVVLVLAALPLAVIVNVARVAGTAIIADHNEQLAMGFYHMLSGWLVFMSASVLLFILAKFLHRWMDPKQMVMA